MSLQINFGINPNDIAMDDISNSKEPKLLILENGKMQLNRSALKHINSENKGKQFISIISVSRDSKIYVINSTEYDIKESGKMFLTKSGTFNNLKIADNLQSNFLSKEIKLQYSKIKTSNDQFIPALNVKLS